MMPIEYSVAAYRFGHGIVRAGYTLNADGGAAMFDPVNPDLRRHHPDGSADLHQGAGHRLVGGLPGSAHVADSVTGIELTGEKDIMGQPWKPATWTAAAAAGTSWTGGTWNGNLWAETDWTGTSWAARTWSARTWSARTWSGSTWTARTWSGSTWSARTWSGGYW